jgi:hypothetical protein
MSSLGPASPEAKAVVSRNAVRHGLYSSVTVCTEGEEEAEWQRFHAGVVESLAPAAELEATLASRAAALLWRVRRAAVAEAAIIDRHLALERNAVARRIEKDERLQRSLPQGNFYAHSPSSGVTSTLPPDPLPDDGAIARLIRVESHLNRQLQHTLHELESLQERRLGRPAPLARVDVHGLPGT